MSLLAFTEADDDELLHGDEQRVCAMSVKSGATSTQSIKIAT